MSTEVFKIQHKNKFKISDKIQMDLKRIILGTVQFGTNYGISNKRGKITQPEAFEILNKAINSGIDTVDTAPTYGNSEQVLGNFMKSYYKKLTIISKLPSCSYWETEKILESSLNKLGLPKIYGYLIHDFQSYRKDKKNWRELERLKTKGKIQKIGFSLYFPSELKSILEDCLKIDIVQIPFSIFDQRFSSYFPELKKRGIEINVRSIFLQGLVFKKPSELNNHFNKIKDKIAKIGTISEKNNIPIEAICLNYAYLNKFIDRVVVGVDSIKNLEDIILAINYKKRIKQLFPQLLELQENDESIILPFNWKTE